MVAFGRTTAGRAARGERPRDRGEVVAEGVTQGTPSRSRAAGGDVMNQDPSVALGMLDRTFVEWSALGLQSVVTSILAMACYVLWRRQGGSYFLTWTAVWSLYVVRPACIAAFLVPPRHGLAVPASGGHGAAEAERSRPRRMREED